MVEIVDRLRVVLRRSLLVGWDLAAWCAAFVSIALLRYDLELSGSRWAWIVAYTVTAMALQLIGGFALHLYLGRSRVGSFDEVGTLALLVASIAVGVGVAFFVLNPGFSRGTAMSLPVFAIVYMFAGRWAFRSLFRLSRRRGQSAGTRALIYGAGEVGDQVARLLEVSDDAPYRVVGFLDDDPSKSFFRVHGHRVLGAGADAARAAERIGAEAVIVAITKITPTALKAMQQRCSDAGLRLLVVPPVRELIGGRVSLGQIRDFDVVDLLGRREIDTDRSQITALVAGRSVLITGAGGSIGSELARQVASLGPSKLILLDRDESALHAVQLSIYGNGLLDTDDMVLCDIRDAEALGQVFAKHRPEIVLHAAALKHLPMLQRFPDEGWKTNVLGTLNVLRCAQDHGVKRVVNVSTDKAADATSVLGQTKRIAERLTAWFAQEYGGDYVSVRFGNVLGSRGSVLYTFKSQIERGGPLTITHPDVSRYFMTIPEACELVLQAAAIGDPGDVLVLDMGEPVKIVDVARRLIEQSGRDIPIEYTGLRPGEKLHEVLLSEAEDGLPSRHPLITQVTVPLLAPHDVTLSDSDDAADLAAGRVPAHAGPADLVDLVAKTPRTIDATTTNAESALPADAARAIVAP